MFPLVSPLSTTAEELVLPSASLVAGGGGTNASGISQKAQNSGQWKRDCDTSARRYPPTTRVSTRMDSREMVLVSGWGPTVLILGRRGARSPSRPTWCDDVMDTTLHCIALHCITPDHTISQYNTNEYKFTLVYVAMSSLSYINTSQAYTPTPTPTQTPTQT
jgi:hypothetical protein